jgi:TldD protein
MDFKSLHKASELQNLSYDMESFGESWRERLEVLLGFGRASGADFVEFFLEKKKHFAIGCENGQITSVEPSLVCGAGVRVFKNKADSYVSTNDLSFLGLKKALVSALNVHKLKIPFGANLVFNCDLEPLRDYTHHHKKTSFESKATSLKETAQILLSCNNLKRKEINHLKYATTSSFQELQEVLVASSDGVFAKDLRLTQSLAANVLCEDGLMRSSIGKRLGNTSDPQFFQSIDEELLVSELKESSGQMLYADYVKAGQYPVVLANKFGGVIFHEACGHLLETTAIQRKSSPFKDKKGEMIANDTLTAFDEGYWEKGFGSLSMDDEGMTSQRTVLIENGILKNFMSDRAGFELTGHPRTGSGRRQNYKFASASRMRNTYIAPGPHSQEELISSIDKGVYCKELGGGSVDPTGAFNFSVQEAYEISKGRITKPLKGAILIGDAENILKKISMCADDIDIAPGFCGSVSGNIYVTVGQPHIKVDSITIGGR